MKTGKKMLAVMLAVVFMLVAGVGLAQAKAFTVGEVRMALKSGKTLAEVMAQAKEDGISIDRVVDACIKAGVKPADVVYVAVKRGGKFNKIGTIIKAALALGANIDDVVVAAKSAGASKEAVISGFVNYAEGTNNANRIYADDTLSYSPPTTSTSVITTYTTTVFTYTVKTTGGKTPSTKTASPI